MINRDFIFNKIIRVEIYLSKISSMRRQGASQDDIDRQIQECMDALAIVKSAIDILIQYTIELSKIEVNNSQITNVSFRRTLIYIMYYGYIKSAANSFQVAA